MSTFLKIVLVEPSLILRSGMSYVLRRLTTFDVQVVETGETEQLEELIAEAAPDVLIINPSLTDEEMLRELQQRLAHMEIAMEFTEDAVQLLANAPKTKQYGARPMKQYLAQMVENTIADKMLRSEVQSGDEICLTAKERRFVVLDKVLPTR